jgi:uncharacterized protein (TIGR02217 family)
LQEVYKFGTLSVVRKIKKPQDATVTLYNPSSGATLSESLYTVDNTTGIVTFSTPPGFTPMASFLFYVPVRFDVDNLVSTYEDVNVRTWDGVKIVEVLI